ncbi:hypothetical protein ACE6H2_014623 [Prunus campanulata]
MEKRTGVVEAPKNFRWASRALSSSSVMGDENISQPSAALTLASHQDDLQGKSSEIEKSLAELSVQQLQLVDLKKSLIEELCLIQDACNHPRSVHGLVHCLPNDGKISNA